MSNSNKKIIVPGGVEKYISGYPKEIQDRLIVIRSAFVIVYAWTSKE